MLMVHESVGKCGQPSLLTDDIQFGFMTGKGITDAFFNI